jgi:nitroreductase
MALIPDLSLTTALIRSRRTLKPSEMDAVREVPRALLMTLLENATWAPTHGITEPWRFRVFAGEARQRLAAALQGIYREVTPAGEFREDKWLKMGLNPLLAPVVIVTWMERCSGDKIPALEEIEAVACALQNAMLSATAAGLGSFWSTAPLLDSSSFKAWLGIGAEDRCLALLYVGWPRDGAAVPRSVRSPVEGCVSWA